MNKKTLLTIILCLVSTIVCYSQSNETLGDNAMSSGNYDKAVEYYIAAISQSPTNALGEKLNKATLLKNEFQAINEAIAAGDAELAETHITNVLLIDPYNKFVDGKRKQLSGHVSYYRSKRSSQRLSGFFLGNNDRVDIFGLGSLDEGLGLLTIPNMSGVQNYIMVQRFQMKFLFSFPFVLDFQTQRGLLKQEHTLWGLGAGSCFFIGDHVTLDYGIGFQRNKMALNFYQKEKGYYYRAGLTFMGERGYGLNYVFNHYVNSNKTSFNCHQISLLVSIGQSQGNNMAVAGMVALLHGIVLYKVLKTMKN